MKAVIFVSDSLRADYVGPDLTPAVEGLADDGTHLKQAFTQAIWTGSAAPSFLYSQYPEVIGSFVGDLSSAGGGFLPVAAAAIDSCTLVSSISVLNGMDDFFPRNLDFVDLTEGSSVRDVDIGERTVDAAIEALPDGDEDFLLIVWTAATHTPFEVPPGHERRADRDGRLRGDMDSLQQSGPEHVQRVQDLYADTVRYADEQFGRLLSALEERNLYDETTVVFTSDHGEVLSEHGRFDLSRGRDVLTRLTPESVNRRFKLFGQFGYVGHLDLPPYDELLRVPLVVKLPKDSERTVEQTELAENIDIGATICDLYDLPNRGVQGTSLLDDPGRCDERREYTYSSSIILGRNYTLHSVRDDRFKYLRFTRCSAKQYFDYLRNSPPHALRAALFRHLLGRELLLDTEAGEHRNVIDEHPEVATELREEFERWHAKNQRLAEQSRQGDRDSGLDDDTREAMKDLGYL